MGRIQKRTVNFTSLDIVADILGAAAIDLAANGESGAQNLQDGSAELLGQASGPHDTRNVDDLVQRNRLRMLNVLFLLAVTRRLLEGLDDEGRSRRNDGDGGLTILDGESHGDTETFLQN